MALKKQVDILPIKNTKRNTLKWLWHVTGNYKGGVAALFAVQVTFGLCGVASAMLFRALIDCAVGGQQTGFF